MVLEPKTITILGSTGSIGCNTVDLIRRNKSLYKVVALTGHSNAKLLAQQALELSPEFVAIGDPSKHAELKSYLGNSPIKTGAGPEAVIEAAQLNADWVMASIVGAAGLAPTLAAIKRGAQIGLANKESLVCAGDLMLNAVKESGATLLPVDSEHNAIFQVLDFEQPETIDQILLTASGGPFRGWRHDDLHAVTPEQAVNHPNWSMGAKISVDSASLMNKGLELIEAYYLFPVTEPQIEVVVHPQSVIHSMVSYHDGSVLAQLGSPDMRTPIAYALGWPNRIAAPSPKLNFFEIAQLNFERPDSDSFPCLRLAREALQAGKSAPAVLNAANEVAVAAFLNKQIKFTDIPKIVSETLDQYAHCTLNTVEAVLDADFDARNIAHLAIEKTK